VIQIYFPGILKILPIVAAVSSFAPFLGVIYWAKVINPAYRGGGGNKKVQINKERKP
jgi:hypothetical protein